MNHPWKAWAEYATENDEVSSECRRQKVAGAKAKIVVEPVRPELIAECAYDPNARSLSAHAILQLIQAALAPTTNLCLAPATLSAGHSLDTLIILGRVLSPSLPRMVHQRIFSIRLEKLTSSFRFAVLKLAQTPTCAKHRHRRTNRVAVSRPLCARLFYASGIQQLRNRSRVRVSL